jgi:ribosomal-protein-alanine N-acetyltransferase
MKQIPIHKGGRPTISEGRRKNYYDHPKEDAIIMTKEFIANGEAKA